MKVFMGEGREKRYHLYFHIFPAEDTPVSTHAYTYKLIIIFVIPSDSVAVRCFRLTGA